MLNVFVARHIYTRNWSPIIIITWLGFGAGVLGCWVLFLIFSGYFSFMLIVIIIINFQIQKNMLLPKSY